MRVKWRLVGEFYLTIGVPIVYLVGLWLIVMRGGEVGLGWMVGGLAVAGVGMVMWLVSYLALGRAFGVLPEAKRRVERGIYGCVEHPMYVGIMLTYVGLAVARGSLSGLGWSLLVMGPLFVLRARVEERRLYA